MTKEFIELKFADFSKVVIKETPHCIHHGAMNKAITHQDGGGIWRCFTLVTNNNDTACRAGCEEKRHYDK